MEQERQQIKFQAVLNRAVLCDTCHLPLTRQRMLIIWNQDQAGVTGLKLVHKITCDDKRMKCSSGAAFGPNWSVAHERAIFAGKAFKHTEDENKLFSALRHVEMGDCHE